jgi:hypothetical protein
MELQFLYINEGKFLMTGEEYASLLELQVMRFSFSVSEILL